MILMTEAILTMDSFFFIYRSFSIPQKHLFLTRKARLKFMYIHTVWSIDAARVATHDKFLYLLYVKFENYRYLTEHKALDNAITILPQAVMHHFRHSKPDTLVNVGIR